MGDEDREFKITITGEAGGIVAAGKQGAGALKEVKAEITDGVNPALANMTTKTEESAKASEHADVSHRAMRFGLRALGPEAAEAGHAMLLGFANPMTAAMIISALAIGKVMEHFQKMREAVEAAVDISGIDKVTEALGEGAMLTALIEGGVAAEEFWEKLNRLSTAQETLKEKTDDATAAIKAQTESDSKQLSAKEKAEQSELKQALAKGTISKEQYEQKRAENEDRYAGQRENRRAIEQDQIIEARKKELEGQKRIVAAGPDVVTDKQLAATKAKGNLEGEKGSLAALEKKLADLDEYQKKYRLEIAQAEAAQQSLSAGSMWALRMVADMTNYEPGMPVSGVLDKERSLLLRQIEEKKQGTIPKAEVAAQSTKGESDEAEKRLTDATKRKAELEREIAKLEADRQRDAATLGEVAAAHHRERAAETQTRGYEQFKSPEGKLVQEVSAIETALAHGQGVSAGQQSQVLALTQLLKSLGAGNDATIKGLASVHETQEQHNARLIALVEKIQQMEARHRDTFNQ